MHDPRVVLLSGGLDSTCVLGKLLEEEKVPRDKVTALCITYGQRHDKEIEAARKVAAYYDIKFVLRDLSEVFAMSDCALLQQSTKDLPLGDYADQQEVQGTDVVSTYVPYRNGLFISVASSIAMSLYPDQRVKVYFGAHADDAAGNAYPDCSEAFFKAIAEAVLIGSGGYVMVKAPFIRKHKKDIVRSGLLNHVPFHLTWSCYSGEEHPCGKCGTCIDRAKAFKANEAFDPLEVSS